MRSRKLQDAGLAVAVLAAQSAPFLFVRPGGIPQSWSMLAYVAVVVTAVPVAFRRHVPVLWLVVSTCGIVLYEYAQNSPLARKTSRRATV